MHKAQQIHHTLLAPSQLDMLITGNMTRVASSSSVFLQSIPRSRILVIDQALTQHVLECGSFSAAACGREIREETSQ